MTHTRVPLPQTKVCATKNNKPRRGDSKYRCHASGLAVDCWDWPLAYPHTAMSALLLHQQRV